jgi:hypothetical protein
MPWLGWLGDPEADMNSGEHHGDGVLLGTVVPPEFEVQGDDQTFEREGGN